VRIVLDTTILVRANESSQGLARQLLLDIVASRDTLLLSNEILYELARVLAWLFPSILPPPLDMIASAVDFAFPTCLTIVKFDEPAKPAKA